MRRRRFSKEFKRESVALFRSSGKGLTTVAKELGVRPQVLRSWERMVDQEGKRGHGLVEQEEVRQLRRDNARLRMEMEILKKAMAFFARESQ
jgi:transposase